MIKKCKKEIDQMDEIDEKDDFENQFQKLADMKMQQLKQKGP